MNMKNLYTVKYLAWETATAAEKSSCNEQLLALGPSKYYLSFLSHLRADQNFRVQVGPLLESISGHTYKSDWK